MAITPLSEATTRILGATIVLNDATSVIKELVDNALDSRATSITIEISANTLDIIQLKDNGTGVGVEDRQLLCKRGCTSKIRTLDDLEKLGGSYLGFRGEALASIANLSESVAITTRVEGELVGSILKHDSHGKLLSSASASHAVGTTIRVQNFLTSVPVRKQTAAKAADKTLSDIKQLLYKFAFARPTVRFAFKVLKGKQEKSNWSYAPCKTVDELAIATIKIVGKEVASSCIYLTAALEDPDSTDERELIYKISAVLLDITSPDFHKSGNVGQFFSLDNRPVDAERGTIKEIAKLYKSYVQQASSNLDVSLPAKPFICAHIDCSPGSYDVNIEPAKGEVMFYNPEVILDVARRLFVQCYGELQDMQTPGRKAKHNMKPVINTSFDLLLARKPQPDKNQLSSHENDTEEVAADGTVVTVPSPYIVSTNSDPPNHGSENSARPLPNMYSMNDEYSIEHDPVLRGSRDDEVEDAALTGASRMVRNPFTTAKMNTRLSAQRHGSLNDQIGEVPREDTGMSSSSTNLFSDAGPRLGPSVSYLPTPSRTPDKTGPYQNPGPPLRRWQPREEETDLVYDGLDLPGQSPQSRVQSNSLDKWIKSNSLSSSARNIQSARDLLNHDGRSDTTSAAPTIGRQQQQQQMNTLSSVSPDSTQSPRKQAPFRSPFKVNVPSAQHTANQHQSSSVDLTYGSNRGTAESDQDLEDVMDFEHRKKALNQRKKGVQSQLNPADLARIQRDALRNGSSITESIDNQGLVNRRLDLVPTHDDYAARFNTIEQPISSPKSSPHQNRYLAATRNITARSSKDDLSIPNFIVKPEEDENYEVQILATTSSASDPRAVVLSRPENSRTSTSKPKRILSSRLPFESIPSNAVKPTTLAVLDSPFPTPTQLHILAATISKSDPYIQSGKIEPPAIIPFSTPTTEWQSRLENLVHTLYRSKDPLIDVSPIETQLQPTVKIPLGRIIKAHIETTLQEKL